LKTACQDGTIIVFRPDFLTGLLFCDYNKLPDKRLIRGNNYHDKKKHFDSNLFPGISEHYRLAIMGFFPYKMDMRQIIDKTGLDMTAFRLNSVRIMRINANERDKDTIS
jgi:hypothetical protein